MILDCAVKRGAAAADREVEGGGEVAVELDDRDGGVAEVDRLENARQHSERHLAARERHPGRQGQAQPGHAHDRAARRGEDRHRLLRRQFICHGSAQGRVQVDRVSPALAGRQGWRLPHLIKMMLGFADEQIKADGASSCRPSRSSRTPRTSITRALLHYVKCEFDRPSARAPTASSSPPS